MTFPRHFSGLAGTTPHRLTLQEYNKNGWRMFYLTFGLGCLRFARLFAFSRSETRPSF